MWCADIGGNQTLLLTASTVDAVHKGTNQKAQQSCGGGTSWGVSSTPRLSWNTWAHVSECAGWNNTQVNMINTVEGSRLQSQECSRCIATYAHFEQSNLLKVLGNRTNPPLSAAPFIPKGHVTCYMCTGDDVINDVITLWNDVTSWWHKLNTVHHQHAL